MTARILVIAGSDSGGGAGIQADIKTITMLGGHAMTAVTAITAQNTQGVSAVHPVPTEMVVAQMRACISDIGVDAVKVGMIGSAETARAVAGHLAQARMMPIVFDPVMVATSGSALADAETVEAFEALMQVATVVTPNLPELHRLSPENDDPIAAALHLVATHGTAVLVKGGHDEGDALADALIEEDNMTSWQGSKIDTSSTHGTGCTLASAIALFLGQGMKLPVAIDRARTFVRLALHGAPGLGRGHGPLGQGSVRLDVGGRMRMNHVTLGFDDYDASVDFYRRLGLQLIVESAPDYARFETAGGATLSLHALDGGAGPGDTTIYFECDALEDEVMRLSREGFAFDHGPLQQSWLWREARLRDPYGNVVCLYSAGENRRYPPFRIG